LADAPWLNTARSTKEKGVGHDWVYRTHRHFIAVIISYTIIFFVASSRTLHGSFIQPPDQPGTLLSHTPGYFQLFYRKFTDLHFYWYVFSSWDGEFHECTLVVSLSNDKHGAEAHMKPLVRNLFIAVILTGLLSGLLPAIAFAAAPSDLVIGNSYTLENGQILNDDLVILGGSVNLQNGSTINGNVFLVGGSLQAAGRVVGDMIVLGGTLNLASTLVLDGNLTTTGTSVKRDPGAQITGELHTGENSPYFILPGGMHITPWSNTSNILLRGIGFFLRLFLWALVAMVVAMFLPNHLTRTSQTSLTQPLISGGLGILTIIVVPIVLVLLAITICLIPITIIGALILAAAWAFGLIALGLEVGKRINTMFTQTWHPAIAAGVGTLLLMTVLSGLEAILPCVGWIPKALVGSMGLGSVLLTQFGMKAYIPNPGTPTDPPGSVIPA
jgi:hypothetical protein